MKTNKTAETHSSPLIRRMLREITPTEKMQTKNKLILAARLEDLIIAKGWNKKEFAVRANKNPSEVTKWLSGTHNFTIDTLAEIAVVLGVSVSELFAPQKVQIINRVHYVINHVPPTGSNQQAGYISEHFWENYNQASALSTHRISA